ncbi:MAG: cache domain-containing protein [Candidatus Hydrogenedentes bacterium]|nr:cache domain-containing protein [Candidatus Hydrogenedentota bacterium]
MKLRSKVGLVIVSVFVVLFVVIAVLQVGWVGTLIIRQTNERMTLTIRSAWQVLDDQRRLMETIAAFLAESDDLTANTQGRALLERARERWSLDLVVWLNPDGTVHLRAQSPETGDRFNAPPLERFWGQDERVSGTFLLAPETVAHEDAALAARCATEGQDGTGMILFAMEPIVSAAGKLQGYLLVGTLLNGATGIVDEIQGNIFSNRLYKDRRVGTVTIFLGTVRVATTVLLPNGERALGTTVSPEVARQVLGDREPWTGRALVVNDWYLSRYEPMFDPTGTPIGMLYVGELELIYEDMKREVVLTIATVLAIVTALAFLASYLGARGVMRQITALDRTTQRIAQGDFAARVTVNSRDEVGDLAQSFNRMADQIEDGHNEIVAKKSALETANRNYLDMLGFVTHELRSTISAAMFNAELLKDGSYGKLEGELCEGVELIAQSLAYLDEITNNYLQLSRLERGELQVIKSRVKLATDVIAPTVRAHSRQFAERSMTVEVTVPDSLVVTGDVNLLRVVYDNLIGNAGKYGRTGGTVLIQADHNDKEVTLSVWNEGKGINRDHLPHLFQKFERFDVDEVTGRKGTGLGLFIVKQLVGRHGGRVWAESMEGHWARFIFTLPVD